MKKLINFTLSKIVRSILNDPVYKDYYVVKSEFANNDVVLSPVMDHQNYMIYCAGLRAKVISREIKGYNLLGRGSEDDMADLFYIENSKLNAEYETDGVVKNEAFN